VFKLKPQLYSAIMALVFCLVISVPMVSESAELIHNPMQPPAFALNKFRLAKLKQNGRIQAPKTTIKKPAIEALNLSSVLIGRQRKVAIINDQTLVVGERIQKYKLVAIFKDRVQLVSGNGKRTELKLANEISVIRKNAVESKL